MKIAICDDSRLEFDLTNSLCEEYFIDKWIKDVSICYYNSGEMLLKEKEVINAIFLDIEMTGLNGLETAMKLKMAQPRALIVFLTSHSECMEEAFGINVLGFLTKPADKQKLFKMLDKITNEFASNKNIELNDYGIPIKLTSSDILYIEGKRIYTDIVMADNNYEVRRTLSEWEEELKDHGFYRVHKSYLVNMRCVKSVGKYLEMKGGKYIPISRSKRQEFERELGVFMWKIARYA